MFGCSKDIVETDAELIPYFDRFVAEGALRGVDVDLEAARIEGLFQNIPDANILGQCFRNEKKPRKVIIDINYWATASEEERETLIFHELGHCFLDRDHRDGLSTDGTCISIMHSVADSCPFDFTGMSKETYLDELFDPQ